MNDIDYVSHRDLANGPFNIYGTNIIGKVISMQGQATGDFTAASKSTISGHKTKWAIDLNDGQDWIALAATVIGAIMADPVQAENDFDLDAFMSGLINGLRGDSFTQDLCIIQGSFNFQNYTKS